MNRVILEDATLATILTKPEMLEAFPWMQRSVAHLQGTNCGACGNRKRQLIFSELRSTIAQLPQADKDRFKQLLGADEVQVIHRQAGHLVELVF